MNDVENAKEIQDTTLQINPPANPITPSQSSGKNKSKIYLILGLSLIFICIGIIMIYNSGGGNFIMSLPFMPKSIEYVLQSSITGHEKVTRFTIDSYGKVRNQINGRFDYTNPDKPLVSVRSRSVYGDDFEVRMKNNFMYKRNNAFGKHYYDAPDLIKRELLHKWFSLDINNNTFDSIQNYNKTVSLQIEKNIFESLDDPEVLKSLTMSPSILNGKPVYHLHFVPTARAFDTFWSKNGGLNNSPVGIDLSNDNIPHYSDYVDKYVLDLWIDKNTYLVSKVTTSFTYFDSVSPSPASWGYNSGPAPLRDSGNPFTFVMNMSDYGKMFDVEIPKDAVNESYFLKSLYLRLQEEQTASQSSNLNTPEANNKKRRVQVIAIENNIFFYNKDQGSLPPEITETDQFISSNGANICPYIISDAYGLPMDPKLGEGSKITKCPTTYNTGYKIKRDAQGHITVTAPYAENSESIVASR
ncbi:MAG: hypothetical protein KKB74_08385 [Bacteroidetes bacterium]|nr:hypothetical protein [Bacteroidota bacterium]